MVPGSTELYRSCLSHETVSHSVICGSEFHRSTKSSWVLLPTREIASAGRPGCTAFPQQQLMVESTLLYTFALPRTVNDAALALALINRISYLTLCLSHEAQDILRMFPQSCPP